MSVVDASGNRFPPLHEDKAHLHLHVALNLIHLETFRATKIFRDHTTPTELAVGLEVRFGLEQTSHEIPNARIGRPPRGARAMEAHTGQDPFVGWVRRAAAGPAPVRRCWMPPAMRKAGPLCTGGRALRPSTHGIRSQRTLRAIRIRMEPQNFQCHRARLAL